ncbi:cytochrome d ubiquinol oxidase subunit II [Hydrotalea sp.]|uniref:cytochrome d ubiquinol oxidase subunit II n=1 Tax=Hydrotalea sp. TaxID=2881279 RepID=UPI0026333846|nr:cytochrome d ubiquinol oxidase subunit II [Hydrotalea sp.]
MQFFVNHAPLLLVGYSNKKSIKIYFYGFRIAFPYTVSGALIGFLLGVVLGNLIIGLPINEHFEYTGHFLQLLNPYALLTGVTTLSLFAVHGSIYLVMKTEKRLYTKLSLMVHDTSRVFVVFYMLLTIVTLVYYPYMANTVKRYPFLIAGPGYPLCLIPLIPGVC